jgi:hypothetical protein
VTQLQIWARSRRDGTTHPFLRGSQSLSTYLHHGPHCSLMMCQPNISSHCHRPQCCTRRQLLVQHLGFALQVIQVLLLLTQASSDSTYELGTELRRGGLAMQAPMPVDIVSYRVKVSSCCKTGCIEYRYTYPTRENSSTVECPLLKEAQGRNAFARDLQILEPLYSNDWAPH